MEQRIPQHIAIILDGNRRWAIENNLPPAAGHKKGADRFEEISAKAREMGVKCMTAWIFSTENWKRSQEQIDTLFELVRQYVDYYSQKCIRDKIRFVHIGRRDRLPQDIITKTNKLEEDTKDFKDFTVAVAADYGGIDEIVRAANKVQSKGLEINRENISANLDTADLPALDLIIRTSGEKRLSGFMTWQSEYAEFYFVDKHFPDFDNNELVKAIDEFSKRRRTFGGDKTPKS